MHNRTTHPAAPEPVVQFPVGPDELLDRANVGLPDLPPPGSRKEGWRWADQPLQGGS